MKALFTSLFSLIFITATAQSLKTDSTKRLEEIVVRGYFNTQAILRSVSAVNQIDSNQIKNQSNTSLVSLFNTISGVRMEERSPGSYRLSLRGSLLRSPFGIRNVKIYFDDLPLTDAGGNTYLNALDFNAIGSIEIFKGPDGSIFGANTGGAILIKPAFKENNQIEATISAGSYGLFNQSATIHRTFKNYRFSFTEALQTSNGYRENSSMNRKYFQTVQQLNYRKGYLKALAFYSDLDYQTPGGLTAVQMEQNPQSSRLATPTLPSAIAQQAGIYNKTLFAGLTNIYQFNNNLKHVISVFGSYTDFKNPFITNYEIRYENTLGLRTFVEYAKLASEISWKAQLGIESSSTQTRIKNFNNNLGSPTQLIAYDLLNANQNFGFVRLNIDLFQKINIELASSLNFYNYQYESYFPSPIDEKSKNFSNQFMPKIALSYLASTDLSFRASVSKGYSPPTIAEVRSSDNAINTNLQAELGWNYEIGARYQSTNNRFYANANIFYFALNDAIVRRLNQNDAEYFINAGGTKQKGLELETALWLIKNENGFLQGLQWRSNYTLSNFKFNDFVSGTNNYSGNKLTGVPQHVYLNSIEFVLKHNFYFYGQYNHTSAIPLNDANTALAKKYNLVEIKTGKRDLKIGKCRFDISAGINNLLNEQYSLGNDLNAVGNRYFNPSMNRNYYIGLGMKL